jgi:hypothetical protein
MIVLATGYEMFSDPETYRPGTVVGRAGFDLGAYFSEFGLQAYEGVAIPGLPNRWTLIGPYSWTGTAWHSMVEMYSDHAVRAITHARARRATLMEVRPQANEKYHAEIRRRGAALDYYFGVLNSDARTYYRNSQGDVPIIRPAGLFEAQRRSTNFPFDDYDYGQLLARDRPVSQADSSTAKASA